MEDLIDVSAIVPCFNQGEFILDAIASIEASVEVNWELIIINDGSTEPLTLEVLQYLERHGYWVINQRNRGLAAARNRGIREASGRYILPVDADNKIRPDYMRLAHDILDASPEIGVVYGNVQFFGDRQALWHVPAFDRDRLLQSNYIDACAVFRKQLWEGCGGYDTAIPNQLGFEDWDLWLTALGRGWQFYRLPEIVFDYRVRPRSMVTRCLQQENHEKILEYLRKKHPDLMGGTQ